MATSMRDEIHQYIEQADERFVSLVYAMMRADNANEKDVLTIEQQEDLRIRIERHRNGVSKSYSWEEAKSIVSSQKLK